jgi:release factor glutamine methyltransferase
MRSQVKRVFFGRYAFYVLREVYEPAEDTFLSARNLNVKEGERVLDMGTGCGILAVLAAERAEKVVAVDVNPHAASCAKKNAESNGVGAKVETRVGDLFEAIADDEKFDLILFNAPYLPVEKDEGASWIEKAWAGGKTGRKVIDRFIGTAPHYLAEKGRILLVQSSLSNVEKTLKRLSQKKLHATIIGEETVVFEKIVLIGAQKTS